VEQNQQAIPTRERLMRLVPDVCKSDDLAFRYEASIVYKLVTAAEELGRQLTPEAVVPIMGLGDDELGREYAARLLNYVGEQQNG
jgi:hypothetical protein